MEKIILGLLMLKGMTIYEIKSLIQAKLYLLCSNSAGSIHIAINKLLEKKYISCFEDKNKKIYSITELGRSSFNSWITLPMSHGKAKNIEASKLFFMGMADPTKITSLINEYISDLSSELAEMKFFYNSLLNNKEEALASSMKLVLADNFNEEGIKKDSSGRSLDETTNDIFKYQTELLNYSIASIEFEISWYKELQKRSEIDG